MYHYVRPIKKSKDPKIKGLELEGFERQIKFFQQNYKFITAGELLDCIYNNTELPKESVLLTFDDGFNDHYSYVYPILKKEEIQGLFFPPAKPIQENIILDVHKIHYILARSQNKQDVIKDIFKLIRKYSEEYTLKDPKEYFSKLAIPNRFDAKEIIFIKRILQRELPQKVRNYFVDFLFKKYVSNDEISFAKEFYLTYENIDEMLENNMFFGSHGYAHDWLAHLNDECLSFELEQSERFLSNINKKNNEKIMCYPYGSYDKRVIDKIKNLGYKIGLTTEVGDAELNSENAFTLKRFDTNDFPQ